MSLMVQTGPNEEMDIIESRVGIATISKNFADVGQKRPAKICAYSTLLSASMYSRRYVNSTLVHR